MLATAVGIDRGGEAHVRAVVPRDDHLGFFGGDRGGELGRRGVLDGPAVVEGLPGRRFIAAGGVGPGAPAAHDLDLLGEGGHPPRVSPWVERNKNILLADWRPMR